MGTTQLIFAFHSNGQEITSNPVDLQVFPPLSLSPRNGTLLMGSMLQLTIKGGPQPSPGIEFTSFLPETAGNVLNTCLFFFNFFLLPQTFLN